MVWSTMIQSYWFLRPAFGSLPALQLCKEITNTKELRELPKTYLCFSFVPYNLFSTFSSKKITSMKIRIIPKNPYGIGRSSYMMGDRLFAHDILYTPSHHQN